MQMTKTVTSAIRGNWMVMVLETLHSCNVWLPDHRQGGAQSLINHVNSIYSWQN